MANPVEASGDARREPHQPERRAHLEEHLHERVIGQDDAVTSVANAIRRLPAGAPMQELAEEIKRTVFKITRVGEHVGREVSRRLGVAFGVVDISLAPTATPGDSVAEILELIGDGFTKVQYSNSGSESNEVALRFAARKRGALLAEGQITEAHVLEECQRIVDLAMGGEEFCRLVHRHAQDLADVPAFEFDLQGFAVESFSPADLTEDIHVGQKAHFNFGPALSLTVLAATCSDVK